VSPAGDGADPRAVDRADPRAVDGADPLAADGADPRAVDGADPLAADGADPLAAIDLETAVVQPGAWLELAVVADHEAVEAVSEILSRAAPGGTSVEPAFELVDEGLAASVDLAQPAIVRAYLPLRDGPATHAAVTRAEQDLGHLQAFGLRPIGDLTVRLVNEADWANAWKAHFPVMRVGRRIVIRPSWRRHRRRAGDIVLALDPGMAFGTGLHPTTRLCLAAIESLADRGAFDTRIDGPAIRVLDVGSGSGILSLAAARFGAAEVVALDVDPIAVEATSANARRNRLSRTIRACEGSVPSGRGPFDLVLANLIASLLITLADGLLAELCPGGTLLASGIFVNREAEVEAAFRDRGADVVGRWTEGDWVALELRPRR
jgi:ribosomal protein L11 methyltransferase